MESSKVFPLFCLPYIVIEEVLSTMNPYDLLNFSLIDSKTNLITRNMTRIRKKKYVIEMGIRTMPRITISVDSVDYDYEITSDESENGSWAYKEREIRGIYTYRKYSENVIEGFMKWAEYVMKVMNCHSVKGATFYIDAFPNENKLIVDWLESILKSISEIEVDTMRMKGDDAAISYILENLKTAKYVKVFADLSENFQSVFRADLANVHISHGRKWLTVQRLRQIHCPQISISESKMKNEDLHQFILSWMSSESNLNLKFFSIVIQTPNDLIEIIGDMPHETVHFGIVRHFQEDGKDVIVYGGYDVTRNDGKKATLNLFAHPHFNNFFQLEMYVH